MLHIPDEEKLRLLDQLMSLYADQITARDAMARAGLSTNQIPSDEPSLQFWHRIFELARREGKLEILFGLAKLEVPRAVPERFEIMLDTFRVHRRRYMLMHYTLGIAGISSATAALVLQHTIPAYAVGFSVMATLAVANLLLCRFDAKAYFCGQAYNMLENAINEYLYVGADWEALEHASNVAIAFSVNRIATLPPSLSDAKNGGPTSNG